MNGPLGAGELRELIGTILLCLMGLFAAVWIVYRNWSGIKELCTDEDGNFDLLGGLERHFSGGGSSGGAQVSPEEVTADEDVMQRLIRQKGAQMADFDPAKDWIREHIIFHGRVQGVGFRYQAMYAARSFDLTGWVENLPDGSVEMEVRGEGGAGYPCGDRQNDEAPQERPLDPDRQDGHGRDGGRAGRAGLRRQRLLKILKK